MSKIKHAGNYFILGKQGREVAKISEIQLLECMEILYDELDNGIGQIYSIYPGNLDLRLSNVAWSDVIKYLQDRREKKMVARTK